MSGLAPSPAPAHLVALSEGVEDGAEHSRVHHGRGVEAEPGEVHGDLHPEVVTDLICMDRGDVSVAGTPRTHISPPPLPGASPSGCASQIACTHDFISRLRILCSCSGKTCWMTPRAASSGTAPRVGGEAGTVPRVPPAWSGLGRRDSREGGARCHVRTPRLTLVTALCACCAHVHPRVLQEWGHQQG